jgi:hypothetical protein
MMNVFSGSCLCGQVIFEATGIPKRVGLCHCLTCRKFTGAPFAAFAIYERDAVKITGVISQYASSDKGRRYRCRYCSCPVYEIDDDSTEIELPLGAFDRTDLFQPQYEAWALRRESWLPGLKSVPTYERNRHA